MSSSLFARRLSAGLLVTLISFSALVQARPLTPLSVFQDDRKPLPQANWIRSRTIDVKHVAIDIKFDWAKDSAFGKTVVTLAPFNDTDTVTLDAAMMTINSVKLVGGPVLCGDHRRVIQRSGSG